MRGNNAIRMTIILQIIVVMLIFSSFFASSFEITFKNNVADVSTSLDASSDWPMFRYDATHSGSTISVTPVNITFKWKKDLGKIESSPVIYNGRLYVLSQIDALFSQLHCIDMYSGDSIWNTPISGESISSPAIINGLLFVGFNTNTFYCINIDTGEIRWYYETNNMFKSSPVVYQNSVFIGCNDYYVYRLDIDSGDLIRKYQTTGPIKSSPAIANNKMFVATTNGYLFGFQLTDEAALWEYDIYSGGDDGQLMSSPTVYDNKLYVGSTDHNIYCISVDGEHVWTYLTGNKIKSSPAIFNGNVYIGSNDENLYCLDGSNGDLQFSYDSDSIIYTSPAIADGKVFFGTTEGMFYCIDANDGTKIWNYESDESCYSSPIVADGKIFFSTYSTGTTGSVYSFGGSSIAPTSNFTIEPEETLTYSTVYFNDTSSDDDGYITSWEWDFGDGNTSTDQHTTHEYVDNGMYNIVLEVTDETGLINSTQKQVTIINRPPQTVNDTFENLINTSITFDVLENDNDIDGAIDRSSLTLISLPDNGTAEINQTTMNVTYTPNSGFVGDDYCSYSVMDDDQNESVGFIHIITSEETDPIGTNDSYQLQEDTILSIEEPGVLSNDQDPDEAPEPMQAVIHTLPSHGTLQLNQNGSFTYDPDEHYYGIDQFTYRVYDGEYYSNVTTVFLTVISVNDAPLANNDKASTEIETQVEIDVLANDTDVDGTIDASTLEIVDNPRYGTASINSATYEIEYTPNNDFSGRDKLSYKVKDNEGLYSNAALVEINVIGNYSPTASFTFSPSDPIINQRIVFSDTSTDVDGSIVNWTWDFDDGTMSYDQNPRHEYDDDGVYRVTLTVRDDGDLTDSTHKDIEVLLTPIPTVSIIEPVNDAVVNGTIIIKGTASVPGGNEFGSSGEIQKVEIRFNSNAWIQIDDADGLENWEYEWDTTSFSDGRYTISARSYDGTTYSTVKSISVTINNDNNNDDDDDPIDTKPEVFILSPLEGEVVNGLVTIHGNAFDDEGVEHVEISINNGDWFLINGTSTWYYDLDTTLYEDGYYTIEVRCFDGSKYSNIEDIVIQISNDNQFSNDDSFFNAQGTAVEGNSSEAASTMFLIIVLFSILVGLVIIRYIIKF